MKSSTVIIAGIVSVTIIMVTAIRHNVDLLPIVNAVVELFR